MELLNCKCNGKPYEIKSGLGCYVYCQKCGYETKDHGYITDAIFEWNRTMSDSKDFLRRQMYETVKNFSFHGKRIPDHMFTGILNYIIDRVEPGRFLLSVLENDLKSAVQNADSENIWILPVYVALFYNKFPSACWGSRDKVEMWLSKQVLPDYPYWNNDDE